MRQRVFLAGIFACALALYTLTLNGDVQPADSGEFQVAGWLLGVPHAPGYPLHTLLSWLISRVPIGSPFVWMSALSALAGAGTLVFVVSTVLHMCSATRAAYTAAALAALALGTSTTFWAQATTVNIRSFTALFSAFLMWAFVRETARPASHRSPPIFGLALGLAIGHHISLAPLAFILLAGATLRNRNWRGLMTCLFVAALCQVVWLYLPLRDAAGARFAPGTLGTLAGLWFHISGSGFQGDQLYFLRQQPDLLWHRLALIPTLLQFQFGRALVALFALMIGAWSLGAITKARIKNEHSKKERSFFSFFNFQSPAPVLFFAAAAHLFITLMYRAPQTVEYALPVWVIVCALFGAGFARVLDALQFNGPTLSAIGRLLQMVLLLVGFVTVLEYSIARLPSFIVLSRDASTRNRAARALQNAAPDSIIFAQWHEATPMWALQDIENFRRDVQVHYVSPMGAQPYAETFSARARESINQQGKQGKQGKALYATSYFADEFARAGLCATPLNGIAAWRLFACPLVSGSEGVKNVFDNRIGIINVEVAENKAKHGDAVEVILTTIALGTIEEDDSVTVRIMRPDGALGANVDFRLNPSAKPGEVQAQRKLMGLPFTTAPVGEQKILAGAYRGERGFKTAAGETYASMTTLNIVQDRAPPGDGVNFAGRIRLTGVTASRSGGTAIIDLNWLALQALTNDYIISVRLEGAGFYTSQDSVPALGAIPTLKWIEGSRISDRHVIDIGSFRGPLKGTLLVYNSVDRVALPIVAGQQEGEPMFMIEGNE